MRPRKIEAWTKSPVTIALWQLQGIQCTEKLLKPLDSNYVNVVLIPDNCTDRLLPLDLSVNNAAKEFFCRSFQRWYPLQVCSQLEGKTLKPPIDLRLSVMKPLGAKWLVDLCDYLKGKPEIIKNSFKKQVCLTVSSHKYIDFPWTRPYNWFVVAMYICIMIMHNVHDLSVILMIFNNDNWI